MVYILHNQEFEYGNDLHCFTVPHFFIITLLPPFLMQIFFKSTAHFFFFPKILIPNLPSPQPSVLPSLLTIKSIILSPWHFLYHKTYPFKVSNSMVSSGFTELSSHHLIYFSALSSPPQRNPIPSSSHFSFSHLLPVTHLQPLKTSNLLSVSIGLPMLEMEYKWNHITFEIFVSDFLYLA